jgi:hypothetical protein
MASDSVDGIDRSAKADCCRKFVLADAMILVVGAALPLASSSLDGNIFVLTFESLPRLCAEAASHRSDVIDYWPVFWANVRFQFLQCAWRVCKVAQIYLYAMTFIFFVLRLKRPRPAIRVLLRQPGTVACLAILFGAVCVSGYLDYFFFYFKAHMHLTTFLAVGGTVAVAWAILSLSGKWQAEPGWIDRIGRLLGYGAIGLAVLFRLLSYSV